MLIQITVPDKLIKRIDNARKTESRASFMRRGAEILLTQVTSYKVESAKIRVMPDADPAAEPVVIVEVKK